MSDEKNVTMTQRERTLELREAFKNGVAFERGRGFNECSDWTAEAKRRYPLPKVKLPRVVTDPEFVGCGWYVNGDRLTNRGGYGIMHAPTPDRVRIWADLLANPTEEVEAE